ncbi:uncharacterized protein LOC121381797 [Gigantopelta aegis]|uniref:uncharacterized protein LOC121381797 n=1 Tax=Gigantopelta aegis TaxID=1735272 RepID=UPI001B888786|nr:uncharacterized protein LOC121381797 [Gigantopelta aegis]
MADLWLHDYQIAVLQHQNLVTQLALHQIQARRRRRRRRRRPQVPRAIWVRPWISRRRQFGKYDQLLVELRKEDQRAFKNFLRMPPEMYDELVQRVGPRITKQRTWYREPLDPGLKIAITLRHIASGTKYAAMKFGCRVPHNTQSLAVREVCQAIIDEYLDEAMTCPTTPEGWREIQISSWRSGTSHIPVVPLMGFYSIVLMALVDADYKFLWADVGSPGASPDAQIYNESELREMAEDGTIGFPAPDPLPNDYKDVPYFFVVDDAFGLRKHTMKRYTLRGLTDLEKIFNYRLSRARRVVENAFGILANRFQILLTTMQHHPSTVKIIVKACIVLHNLMRTRYPTEMSPKEMTENW